MSSLGAKIIKSLIRLYTYPYRKRHLSLSRNVSHRKSKYKPPKTLRHFAIKYDNVNFEVIEPVGQSGEYAVLMFHGGGETQGIGKMYRKAAEKYCAAIGGKVYIVDYTTGKDLRYPSLHDECLNAYKAILRRMHGNRIIAAGDSMGANLMLSACLKAREEKLPLPRALIVISCFADLAATGTSYKKNCHTDPLYALPKNQSYEQYGKFIRRIPLYCGNTDPKDPYLSPAYATFENFPDMLIQCGDCETSESDSDMVYNAAKKAGVNAILTKYGGMFHDFQYLFPFLKESKAAWKEITAFISSEITTA